MRTRAPALAAVLLAVPALLGGCASGVSISGPGPLVDASNAQTFCLSAKPGAAVALGWDLLYVDGNVPATIKDVSLSGASGLTLTGAQLVPIGDYLVGNGWSYPLTAAEVRELPKGVDWTKSRPAVGAVVRPSAKARENLVAGLRATGAAGGTATGLTLTYVAGGTTYQVQTSAGVDVVVAPHKC
jgi:hypothetical protein